MVSGLLNTAGFQAPVPVFPGGPGSAHCPPTPWEDRQPSDLPDQPIEALGLSAPIRAYDNGSITYDVPCSSELAGVRSRGWHRWERGTGDIQRLSLLLLPCHLSEWLSNLLLAFKSLNISSPTPLPLQFLLPKPSLHSGNFTHSRGERLQAYTVWIQIPPLFLTSCVTLGKLLNFSVPYVL